MSTHIQHPGFVTSLHDDVIRISLVESSGCSACHNGFCMMGDSGSRQLEFKCSQGAFNVGDEVMVRIRPSLGYAAVAWLYAVPFLLVLGVLLILTGLSFGEGVAGLCALTALAPYYGVVFALRKRIRRYGQLDVIKR